MPANTTLSSSDRQKVQGAIETAGCKIVAAGLARIYFAYPNPNEWSYGGLQGAFAFVNDKNSGIFYFRMVDLVGTRGVIWEHELYEGFEYNEDRSFFHSFSGDVRMAVELRCDVRSLIRL
jgi:neural Wiskott-Aldrich syndrome protein